jgi:ABC-type nitrate/sulfonate/bicarbonate transport system permease component
MTGVVVPAARRSVAAGSAASSVRAPIVRRPGMPALWRKVGLGTIGVVAMLAAWEAIGRNGWFGSTWPPLSTVLETLASPQRRPVLQRAFGATVGAAGRGFVLGSVLATAAAAVGFLVPVLRMGIDRLAAVLHALPIIALAPLFIVTVGRTGTPVAISTLATFFTMFVATTSAFHAVGVGHAELFTVGRATRWQRLVHLELPAALPGVADGLRMAAPAAVLGAVLGEWFGAPRGIGLLIVSAMQNYQIPLLWSAALMGAALSMVSYGLLSLVARAAANRFGERS